MAVSLEKKPFIREYTPVHLVDEEESVQKRDNRGNCSLGKESVSKHDAQDSLMIEEIGEHSEQPQSKRERFAEKIGYIWDVITDPLSLGAGKLIVMTIIFVLLIVLAPVVLGFGNATMSDIYFNETALETTAEIISVGSAENRDVQGIIVVYKDIYGNEQKAKAQIDKSVDVEVGDVISIKYSPNYMGKIKIT